VLEELDASTPAGDDQGSDANSTAMSLSGTPEGLQKLLDKHYEPEIESIDRFLTRLNRVAVALAAQDCPVDEDIYRCKYWDAELRAQLHPHNPAQQLAYLKQLFADMVMSTDSEMTDMERDWRLEVVQGRMKDHGFTSPERYVRKLAAGSPPSYQGTPFKFVVPGMPHLSATIPELPTFGAGPQGQRRQGIGSGTPSSGTYGENGQEASMMAEMMDRMERMERHSKEGALAEAMLQQTDMLSRIINKPEGPRRGAIRVEPKVAWPVLDQDNLNVDEFFDEYENICGLANDCRGLGPQEMLLALKASLRGSRLDTYNNMRQICQEDGTLTTDPGGVYAAIKAKLLRFCRTFEEKQTLALTEWGSLFKGALNSLEFETRWDRATRKLQKYGLTRSAEELKITYLCKINKVVAANIRRDRRMYPGSDGTETLRQVSTWEEAHAIAMEMENDNSATKAITNPSFALNQAFSQYEHAAYYGEQGYMKKGICFDMVRGACARGDNCKYSHEPADVKAARKAKGNGEKFNGKGKGATVAAVEAPEAEWVAKAGRKGKKSKEGKEGKAPWPGKGGQNKHILCKHIKKGETCPYGEECKFSHNKKKS
jgi:hypothetical protein